MYTMEIGYSIKHYTVGGDRILTDTLRVRYCGDSGMDVCVATERH